jgi:AAA domain/Toprim domain
VSTTFRLAAGGSHPPMVLPTGEEVELDGYLDGTVYPTLFDRLPTAFPEFGWSKHGDTWEAGNWPSDFPYPVNAKRPDRLMVYRDRPWWIKVHGHDGVRFLDLVNGGRRPKGDEFLPAIKQLCERAGVACPERHLTHEQQERARRFERRRSVLEDFVAYCAGVLQSERGEQARSYFRDTRGLGALAEDFVKLLGLGLHLSVADARRHLKTGDHSDEAIREASVLWSGLEGYITIPWRDARGRMLTIYGRWPGDPPGKKPKTTALPGKDSKAVPLCLDHALHHGQREVVVVEGVFDAALLQVMGDFRVVASVAAQLNGEQINTLHRCRIERVFICGDPDGGGDSGTLANVKALGMIGIPMFVVPRLPDGLDPDDFARQRGIDTWREHVAQATHGYRHVAVVTLAKHRPADGWTDSAREAAVAEAVAFAASLPAGQDEGLDRYLLPEICREVGGSVETLRERIRCERAGKRYKGNGEQQHDDPNKPEGDGDASERSTKAPPSPTEGITAAELINLELEPPRCVVSKLIPDGLTILASKPKKGKSWLALQIAFAVATHRPALDSLPTIGGHVLYIGLEDTRYRLRDRLTKNVAASGHSAPDNLHLFITWKKSPDGGLYDLTEWLTEHPSTTLVVIDTLAKIRKKNKNVDTYTDDDATISELKALADKFRAAILLIHHTRKAPAEDPFDEVSGTLGLNGAADSLLVLDRPRGESLATLYTTGRDLPEASLSLRFDDNTCMWS